MIYPFLVAVNTGSTSIKKKNVKKPNEKQSWKESRENRKPLFVENLTCDCAFITHHTISGVNLTGPHFLARKDKIVAALDSEIKHGDMDRMAAYRRSKRTL